MTFKQFVAELSQGEVTISPLEIEDMKHLLDEKVLQMGHLRDDGSMCVPVDCIVEAARSLEPHTLAEAAEIINGEHIVSMLQSGESLVERVGKARERKLRRMIREFQTEGGDHQWKQIEKEIFGVNCSD